MKRQYHNGKAREEGVFNVIFSHEIPEKHSFKFGIQGIEKIFKREVDTDTHRSTLHTDKLDTHTVRGPYIQTHTPSSHPAQL